MKAYEAFKEAPVRFLTFVLVCMAVFMVYSQQDAISEAIIKDPAIEGAEFNSSIDRDILINNSLEDFLQKHSAKAAKISQYHNGQYDLTNLPFHKVTTTYYMGPTNSLVEKDLFLHRPISTMAKTNFAMWREKDEPTCVGYEVEDVPDMAYRMRLNNLGYTYVYLCPIENLREYPIGHIMVAFDFIPEEEGISYLRADEMHLASRIAGYLQEGSK